MGFFDKKYCDVCGEKIGLLGNRKLEDGNLCKNCASKLSPFFSDRRKSTVDMIKAQLLYRENNKKKLETFHAARTLGEATRILIDDGKGCFVVTSSDHMMDENPDMILLSEVTNCQLEVQDRRNELKCKDSEGKLVSYDPPRYEYFYDFYIKIGVSNPFFDLIRFRLNRNSVKIISEPPRMGTGIFRMGMDSDIHPEYNVEYRQYQQMGDEIIAALTGSGSYGNSYGRASQNTYQSQPQSGLEPQDPVGMGAVGTSQETWTCACGSVNQGKFCPNCGATKTEKIRRYRCDKCGWEPEDPAHPPKFCPSCGDPFNEEDAT